MDSCQRRADDWRVKLTPGESVTSLQQSETTGLDSERLCKAMALIVVSYDEWGSDVGDDARNYLEDEMLASRLSKTLCSLICL